MIGRRPYRKRKSYTLTIVIVLLALFISISAVRDFFAVRPVFAAITYPFQFVVVSVWKGVTGTPGAIMDLHSLSRRNAELTDEVNLLSTKMLSMEELIKENERLKKSLSFRNISQYRYRLLPAQIIGKSPVPWFTILISNKGSRAGVKLDDAVMVKEGLVGRVVEVSPFSSKIMLITDVESSVAAADKRSRDFGVVVGAHRNRLVMRYVSAGKDIKIGDEIATAYISTVFPQGIPIGHILRASKGEHDLFYHIDVKPAVDFSKLEEVFIVL
ncbi:MAG: rod shape-determining protein MreC [Candidatus Margulisiibacteriota bacterium]|nr:rod shape-determining protein MreC [Candidatus Margulisiibacteriota bacterium]